MADYPLLVFPNPVVVDRSRRRGFPSHVRIPTAAQQAERLAPQFQRLQDTMNQKRVSLQGNPLGIQPEQVLVLETVGSIDNFTNALKRIDGLEWMGELENLEIGPDHGFQDENNPDRFLRGQLFMVMTDQRALQEMQAFFDRWREGSNAKFPYGLSKLKQAFEYLYAVRPWDAEDRIRDTNLLEDWEERLQFGDQPIPFEADLWFRSNSSRRQASAAHLHSIVESLGGKIITECVVPEILYHGVLGIIPPERAQEILSREEVRLLQCDGIMRLRPVGQCGITLPEDSSNTNAFDEEPLEPPNKEPLVALLDGLPLTRHNKLDGWIQVDDPDDYESDYQANQRFHGTTMASLICHGDLHDGGESADRWIYSRPIMKPKLDFNGQSHEAIPEDVLPVDLIHRVVRRMYESINGEPPAAPSVRVINLSVCDGARPFDREISPLARLLDWLSWEYGVLFIVSAGNHDHELELDLPREDLQKLTGSELEDAVIKALPADSRHRRLLSPSETINGITLGASHEDVSENLTQNLIDPFPKMGQPSVTSAQGPGYRRIIKPDVLLPGGRQLLAEKLGNTHPKAILRVHSSLSPPGQLVAAPGFQGELNQTCSTRGTSNATALASRGALFLHRTIEELRQQSGGRPPTEYDTVLLKALLVHGANWTNTWEVYQQALQTGKNKRRFRDFLTRFLGYGPADIQKVMVCTDQRATVLGVGELGNEEAAEFVLPLPPSLSAVTDNRRLTITLAWLTPIASTTQKYRVAHLWFNPTERNIIATKRRDADFQAVQRGTVQHEVLEGYEAVPYQDGTSLIVKVNCRDDAARIREPIRFGLAVTLEVAESLNVPVYQEIRDRLLIPVIIGGPRFSGVV